jgi:hypothetical protein
MKNYAMLKETPGQRAHFSYPGSYLVLYENAENCGIGIKILKISQDRNAALVSPGFLSLTVLREGREVFSPDSPVETTFEPEVISSLWHGDDLTVCGRYFFLDAHTLQFSVEIKVEVDMDGLELKLASRLNQNALTSAYWLDGNVSFGSATLKSPDSRSTMPFSTIYWAFLMMDEWGTLPSGSEDLSKNLKVPSMKAGQTLTFYVIMPFALNNPGFFREKLAAGLLFYAKADRQLPRIRQARKKLFSELPALPVPWLKENKLYYHAVTALLNNTLQPNQSEFNGTSFNGRTACYPCKGGYDGCWYWDSAFHVTAMSRFAPEKARDNAAIHLENLTVESAPGWVLPNTSWADGASSFGWVKGITVQPPFMIWALGKYFSHTRDIEFIRQHYSTLVKMHRWWYENRDPEKSGLCGYRNGFESGMDNSSRWLFSGGRRSVSGSTAIHRAQKPMLHLKAVDLNSFLLIEKRQLAGFAELLGKKQEAITFQQEIETLEKLISEYLYDAKRNIFVDYDWARKKHSPVIAISSFMPLWAGVTLREDLAEQMLKNYLLNEDYFYGDYPFPSVSFADPDFDSRAMWRGGVWMNFNYFCIRALRRYGFNQEIDRIKRKIFKMVKSNPSIGEWYDSRNGRTLSKQEFGWTAAFLIELLNEK